MKYHDIESRIVNLDVEDRKGIIGGSSVGAIIDEGNAFQSQLEVAEEFLGTAKPKVYDEETLQKFDFGHKAEDLIADIVKTRYNVTPRRVNGAYQRVDAPWAICHPDRVDLKNKIAFEFKTSSFFAKGFGEEWTASVPKQYLLQCYWYFICGIPVDTVWLVRLVDNNLKFYKIDYSKEICDLLFAEVSKWVRHVSAGILPVARGVANEACFTVEDSVEADAEAVSIYEKYKDINRKIKELEGEAKSLKEAMELKARGHEAITITVQEGRRTKQKKLFYWVKPRTAFDAEHCILEHPDYKDMYSKTLTVIDEEKLLADHPEMQGEYRKQTSNGFYRF